MYAIRFILCPNKVMQSKRMRCYENRNLFVLLFVQAFMYTDVQKPYFVKWQKCRFFVYPVYESIPSL